MPLTLSYVFTAEMKTRSVKELYRQTVGIPWWSLGVFLWLILSAAGIWGLSRSSMMSENAVLRGALAAAAAGLITLYVWRKSIPQPGPDEAYTVSFTESGMESRTSTTRTELDWKAFKRFVDSDTFFLLYTGEALAYAIPKSALSNLEAFRACLRERIPSTPGRGNSILGKSRPIFFLVFILGLAFFLSAGRALLKPIPDINVAEFQDLKARSLIQEIRSREGVWRITLKSDFVKNGTAHRRVRLVLPGDPSELPSLFIGLPDGVLLYER